MAYGTEVHTPNIVYQVILEHTPTGNRVTLDFDPYHPNGSTPTEQVRDQLFQGFLTHLATLGNTTIISATKQGGYTTPVTA